MRGRVGNVAAAVGERHALRIVGSTLPLHHADDVERPVADLDALPQRIVGAEQLPRDAGAQHDDALTGLHSRPRVSPRPFATDSRLMSRKSLADGRQIDRCLLRTEARVVAADDRASARCARAPAAPNASASASAAVSVTGEDCGSACARWLSSTLETEPGAAHARLLQHHAVHARDDRDQEHHRGDADRHAEGREKDLQPPRAERVERFTDV